MPTRKEILADLDESVEGLADALEAHRGGVEDALWRVESATEAQAIAVARGAQSLENAGRSVARAGADVAGGLIASAAITVVGGAIASVIGAAFKEAIHLGYEMLREMRQKGDVINSLQKLQETHDRITYEFAAERTYAFASKKRDRKNVLNALILDGIVVEYEVEGNRYLKIDEDSEALADFWEGVEAVVDASIPREAPTSGQGT